MKLRARIFVGAFVLMLVPVVAAACTTFCFNSKSGGIFGKNYDWNIGDGAVIVNASGVSKVAMTEAQPAHWVARYGSVTFNQYGRNWPSGGINEAGLVVELMWLDDTVYPEPDERPTVGVLGWIQFQLDNCASVGEVIASDSLVRVVTSTSAMVHYLVADRAGEVATIEFLEGRMVAHRREGLPLPVLTNSTYESSLSYYDAHADAGLSAGDKSSLGRFATAGRMLDYGQDGNEDPVSYAFAILDSAAQADGTKWSIVYDIGAMEVHYRTELNRNIRHLRLADVSFNCAEPVVATDVDRGGGDVSASLSPFTCEDNYALLQRSFRRTHFLSHITDSSIRILARRAESDQCQDGDRSR